MTPLISHRDCCFVTCHQVTFQRIYVGLSSDSHLENPLNGTIGVFVTLLSSASTTFYSSDLTKKGQLEDFTGDFTVASSNVDHMRVALWLRHIFWHTKLTRSWCAFESPKDGYMGIKWIHCNVIYFHVTKQQSKYFISQCSQEHDNNNETHEVYYIFGSPCRVLHLWIIGKRRKSYNDQMFCRHITRSLLERMFI